MVNKWTLEFEPGEVTEKKLQKYKYDNAKAATYLLFLVQILNVCLDVMGVINSVLTEGASSKKARNYSTIIIGTDILLAVLYLVVYYMIKKGRWLFRGLIALLCSVGIISQIEANIWAPVLTTDLDVLLVSPVNKLSFLALYTIVCWNMTTGEDNFIILSIAYMVCAVHILLREAKGLFFLCKSSRLSCPHLHFYLLLLSNLQLWSHYKTQGATAGGGETIKEFTPLEKRAEGAGRWHYDLH